MSNGKEESASGTLDVTLKSAATRQQHLGKTVYHISVVLNEIQGDAAVPELGKARISCTPVDNSQPGAAMNIVAMEHSPKLGRAQLELNRWPSKSRTVLRRTRQDEARLARLTVSMYGDSEKHSTSSQPDQQRLLRRPRSVCVLPGPGPLPLEPHTCQPFNSTGVSDNDQQQRSRKVDLRAVDGLNHVGPQRLVPVEVSPRVRQRSWKPRPVSMTVLELKKRGSDDEIDSQKSYSNGGGFLKGGFRWRLFGKTLQDKSRDREYDKTTESSPKSSKSDAPKSTFRSLRRSISLRIRRTLPKEKDPAELETEPKERFTSRSTSVEATLPAQPFSYLTGRTLSTSSRQLEDGGTQYIQYHSKGKVKVMEVPLYPKKLSCRPVQENPPSIWHLIASRFRRKEQPFHGKCEAQLSHCKSTPQYPLTGSSKPQPVTIETLAGTDYHKGQDSFVNSQEWTLSRSVPELKVVSNFFFSNHLNLDASFAI
ncbi:unnamed protein product [Tetraodon nigroviridis]|uniref:(spotted green pufferfish) hypothetical protein n=1 Tax=Tetraodon nigroviridis TaxID=99883 RepID=Q4SLM8_TETNG|nr:unnamed protein product [Tetraodon nigroviridis]